MIFCVATNVHYTLNNLSTWLFKTVLTVKKKKLAESAKTAKAIIFSSWQRCKLFLLKLFDRGGWIFSYFVCKNTNFSLNSTIFIQIN